MKSSSVFLGGHSFLEESFIVSHGDAFSLLIFPGPASAFPLAVSEPLGVQVTLVLARAASVVTMSGDLDAEDTHTAVPRQCFVKRGASGRPGSPPLDSWAGWRLDAFTRGFIPWQRLPWDEDGEDVP